MQDGRQRYTSNSGTRLLVNQNLEASLMIQRGLSNGTVIFAKYKRGYPSNTAPDRRDTANLLPRTFTIKLL